VVGGGVGVARAVLEQGAFYGGRGLVIRRPLPLRGEKRGREDEADEWAVRFGRRLGVLAPSVSLLASDASPRAPIFCLLALHGGSTIPVPPSPEGRWTPPRRHAARACSSGTTPWRSHAEKSRAREGPLPRPARRAPLEERDHTFAGVDGSHDMAVHDALQPVRLVGHHPVRQPGHRQLFRRATHPERAGEPGRLSGRPANRRLPEHIGRPERPAPHRHLPGGRWRRGQPPERPVQPNRRRHRRQRRPRPGQR